MGAELKHSHTHLQNYCIMEIVGFLRRCFIVRTPPALSCGLFYGKPFSQGHGTAFDLATFLCIGRTDQRFMIGSILFNRAAALTISNCSSKQNTRIVFIHAIR